MKEQGRYEYSAPNSRLKIFLLLATVFSLNNVAAGAPKTDGKIELDRPVNGRLDERSKTKSDETEQPRTATFKLAIGTNKTITIEAESEHFNTKLRVIDSKGKVLLEDDDGGIGHNARLVLLSDKASNQEIKEDLFIELTSQGRWDLGDYKLSVLRGDQQSLKGKEKIDADIAYCERAAQIADANNAPHRKGWVLATLAWNHSLIGRYDQLRKEATAAKEIAEQFGDRKLLAFALKNIGAADWYQGRANEALPNFEKALQIRRDTGDRKGEAGSLDNLGTAHLQLNDRRRAINCFEQALAIYRDLRDERGQSNSLGNLGISYYLEGDYDRATDYYRQALDIRRKTGDKRGEAYDLSNIGVVYAKRSDYALAITYYDQAIRLHHELGDLRGEARDLDNLSKAYVFVGEVKRAAETSKEAERIRKELEDR